MIYYAEYIPKEFNIIGKRKKICNDIFTLDIETTSCYNYNGIFYPAIKYKDLSEVEKEKCKFFSFMYIWQISINDEVIFGRTYEELKKFLNKLEVWCPYLKIFFVHNLSFEFQFLRGEFNFHDVLARKARHVMKAYLDDYNIEFRCSYMMSNTSLAKLSEFYNLDIKKLTGDLDYTLIRNSKTILSEKEMQYCENDCLIVYEYIKKELKIYERVDKIPLTITGHVRREFKNQVAFNWKYKSKVRKAINVDGHIFNLLQDAFQGGYTHSNWYYTDVKLKNIDSFDFTSSYPFVMVTEKYPAKEFKKCNIKSHKDLLTRFAYILRIKFYNIKSKYLNNFISLSKCKNIKGARYDNGRIVSAAEFEMTLTDIDFKFYLKAYDFDYEILESYFSIYEYLPIDYINFILEKYIQKTELKNVEGKEDLYMIQKSQFNSLYGMSVTNTIRDEVIYSNIDGWSEEQLTNNEIIMKLQDEKNKGFLSFAYGVWVTAYARNNLLENVLKLDDFVVYCDTDSIKLVQGYDENIIEQYNLKVKSKIKKVSEKLEIPIEKYSPKDIKGISHMLGLFEKEYTSKENKEYTYKEFITQGAKKYAYKTMDNDIKITVAGVPKRGASALNKIEDFKDNLLFKFEDTGKNILMYNDFQENFNIEDYQGNIEEINQKTGACILPATYLLRKIK